MGLGIVLKEEEMVATADVGDTGGVGTLPVEVDNHDDAGTGGDSLFDEGIVNLAVRKGGLNKNGRQAAVSDGQNGGDIGIGWYNDFIAGMQVSQFDVGTEYQRQGIKAVGTRDAIACTDIVSIRFLEGSHCPTLQVPAAVDDIADGLAYLLFIRSIDAFEFQVFHNSHS